MSLKHSPFLYIILFLTLSMTACKKSTQEKIEDFIKTYNNVAAFLSDPIIIRTFAKPIASGKENHGHISVIFVSNLEKNDPKLEFYNAMLPGLFASLVKNNKTTYDLIKENVRFEILLCSEDQEVLKKIVIDKDHTDLLASKEPAETNNKLSNFQQILKDMNQSLPVVVNQEMGLTMTKIDISNTDELIYHLEVADTTAHLFRNANAAAMLKDEILRGQDIKGILSRIKIFGLKNVKYVYADQKGKLIDEIVITDKDL